MITKSIIIQNNINIVFKAFANLDNWQSLLDDVLNVEMLYDDGYHQEFLMTMSRPRGVETIRGFCFFSPNSRIEIFQPKPPSGFKTMTDIWTFEESKEGTRVTVERRFELAASSSNTVEPDRSNAAYEEARLKLSAYLSKDLNVFKSNLEAKSYKAVA
ncbi:SRPBCC family protein [Aetokthonos hydrillicola Thurmond2011]|uniref:SRPBCC family protein n=1 Tax=Aetokthonos hydrillicola Thurmond2011 TaxID=2712845 RepID=A0AAP5IE29_9CYAN|nr:SRPBCC family protein [Aetokthonos hydrillicola]MBO3459175.1 SRPBCC family protein [Aetokthonos hydrillicola CCALA 1050]MBW4584134.1 SRPBCC family protein [Aetokthonos hydrillicola CCALA 1050]MDR9898332.1 SRPBCC family protein [Aetokthonos hydrillicola Thurmond2011]